MDNSKFPEPRLAKGNIVPDFVVLNELKEAKEKELRRKQFIHDWKIAIVSLFRWSDFGICNIMDFLGSK